MDGEWTSVEASLVNFASEIIGDINTSYSYWEGSDVEKLLIITPRFDRNQTQYLLEKFKESKEWAEKLY